VEELAAPLVSEEPTPCLATEVAIVTESAAIPEPAIIPGPSLSAERRT
jgi:hypothetical protein